MRTVILALLGLLTLSCAAPSCAQAPLTARAVVVVPREVPVYITDRVRLQMNLAWDTRNPQQPERAYCVVTRLGVVRGDSVYIAVAAYRIVPAGDDPYWVDVDCGPEQTILHTHTPTTCDHDATGATLYQTCIVGGSDAYLCMPSNQDQALINHVRMAFALIQCDRNAFIAYYPDVIPDSAALDSAKVGNGNKTKTPRPVAQTPR